MSYHIPIAPIAMLLALGSLGACSMEHSDDAVYGAMDADSDGQISKSEFNDYYRQVKIFAGWDANGDDRISEQEFGGALFDYYDENDDGFVVAEEWDADIVDPGDNGFWSQM